MADDAMVFAMANPTPGGHAGGGRAVRADHRHRALGLPEPDQQRPLLPGHLPRRARRPRPRDHRGHEDGRRARDRGRGRRRRAARGPHHPVAVQPRRAAAVAAAVAEQAKREGSAESPTPARSATRRATRRSSGRSAERALTDHRQPTGRLGSPDRRRADRPRRRGHRAHPQPGQGARDAAASRPSPGTRSPAPRRPTRSPAATRSCTWPERTSPSAGTTTRCGGSASRASSARATSSPASRAAEPRPRALISASAVGYYGHRPEPIDEDAPPGRRRARRRLRGMGARGRSRRRRSASASCACAPASCSTATAARCRRCCCRSGSASAVRWPAGASRCRGSTSTTSSGSTCTRSTTSAGAARSTPPRRIRSPTASSRARSAGRCTARRSRPCRRSPSALLYGGMAKLVVEGQNALPRRDDRARVRAPAPGSRRGAALGPRRHLTTARGSLVTS